jgi:hypothetical protein
VSQHKLDYALLFKIWNGLLVFIHIFGTGTILHFLYYAQQTLERDYYLHVFSMIIAEIFWLPALQTCKSYYILSKSVSQAKIFSDVIVIQRGKKKLKIAADL